MTLERESAGDGWQPFDEQAVLESARAKLAAALAGQDVSREGPPSWEAMQDLKASLRAKARAGDTEYRWAAGRCYVRRR